MPGEGMDTLTTILIALLGGGGVGALIAAYFGRRKTAAEAAAIESQTKRADDDYNQKRAENTREQMHLLESEVRGLKLAMDAANVQSEQRAGGLYAKISDLATSLEKANTALVSANETIALLRQEVKDGNGVIANLNETITKLLVEQAKAK